MLWLWYQDMPAFHIMQFEWLKVEFWIFQTFLALTNLHFLAITPPGDEKLPFVKSHRLWANKALPGHSCKHGWSWTRNVWTFNFIDILQNNICIYLLLLRYMAVIRVNIAPAHKYQKVSCEAPWIRLSFSDWVLWHSLGTGSIISFPTSKRSRKWGGAATKRNNRLIIIIKFQANTRAADIPALGLTPFIQRQTSSPLHSRPQSDAAWCI